MDVEYQIHEMNVSNWAVVRDPSAAYGQESYARYDITTGPQKKIVKVVPMSPDSFFITTSSISKEGNKTIRRGPGENDSDFLLRALIAADDNRNKANKLR